MPELQTCVAATGVLQLSRACSNLCATAAAGTAFVAVIRSAHIAYQDDVSCHFVRLQAGLWAFCCTGGLPCLVEPSGAAWELS
jgi:hypothetical protein